MKTPLPLPDLEKIADDLIKENSDASVKDYWPEVNDIVNEISNIKTATDDTASKSTKGKTQPKRGGC